MSQEQRDMSQLSEIELRQIVDEVRQILSFDFDKNEWDQDKEWDWDTIEFVAGLLEDHGLGLERKDGE
jgi:hypothetical protein